MAIRVNTFHFSGAFEITPETVELEGPGEGQVLVENDVSLISPGTELALYTGIHTGLDDPDNTWASFPFYPGYAAAGTVKACGSGVRKLEPGERVCHMGTHASHAVFKPASSVYGVVPDAVASHMAAFVRLAQISRTASVVCHKRPVNVLVIGGGLIGNLAAQLFLATGAERVMISDPIETRLKIARACGIEAAINPVETPVEEAVAEATDGAGADVVVEATGVPQLVGEAIRIVNRYGEVILLGSTRGAVEIDVYATVHKRTLTITGAHESSVDGFSKEPLGHSLMGIYEEVLGFIVDGKLRTAPLITHTVRPDEVREAYEGLEHNKEQYLGVLIDWREQ